MFNYRCKPLCATEYFNFFNCNTSDLLPLETVAFNFTYQPHLLNVNMNNMVIRVSPLSH